MDGVVLMLSNRCSRIGGGREPVTLDWPSLRVKPGNNHDGKTSILKSNADLTVLTRHGRLGYQ